MLLQKYLPFAYCFAIISAAALGDQNFDVGPDSPAASVTHYDPLSAVSPLPIATSTSVRSVESTSSSGKAVSSASISVYSGVILMSCLLSVAVAL
ncbi:hypothetical protein JA1_002606 [Spathaspora sp. JA1]|nr:hypothetical protein JA1_002606 [Spathaspora sp. JA1]